jgi:uncharacterized protein DUF4386
MHRVSASLIGGAAGLLLVILFIVSIPLASGEPGFDASPESWLAYYRTSHHLTAQGLYEAVSLPCFIIFMAGLWIKLRSTDDATRLAAVVLLVGASATLVMRMASGAANEAAAIRVDHGLDVSEAGALADLATGFFVMSWISLAVSLFAAGVGIMRSRSFPRWLGWAAVVIGAAQLAAPVVPLTSVWGVALVAFYIWVVAISVVMLRSAVPAASGMR